jgi:Zn-dependent M32 family carboxypeptidase
MEQLRTKEQHKRLFGLLKHLGWLHYREDLALQYSDGRSKKTSGLTNKECEALIQRLQHEVDIRVPESKKKMLSKFFAYCHRLGWETAQDKPDYQRINNWLLKYSYLKKGINDYTVEELPKLLNQITKLLPKDDNKDEQGGAESDFAID